MQQVKQVITWICSSLRLSLWLLLILVIGGLLVNYEVAGLAKIFPMPIAVSLASVVMVMLAVFSHRARRTGCRTCLLLAMVFLIVTAFQFGLSFNEHLKHEGGKHAQGIEAISQATAIDQQWTAAKADLANLIATEDALASDVAGLEALEEHGTRMDAELESLAGKIFTINHDGKAETAADLEAIRLMEGKMAALEEQKATTAMPTRQELAGKRVLWLAAKDRVARAEAEVAKLAEERLASHATAHHLKDAQHAFFSIANRTAKADRDKTSLILIGAGFFWGLAIHGGFSWLCTLGIATRNDQDFVAVKNDENGNCCNNEGTSESVVAENIIAPQFRKPAIIRQRVLPKPATSNGKLSADQVKSLTRKLNKERLLDRAYKSSELDQIPIPVRRFMCEKAIDELTDLDCSRLGIPFEVLRFCS